MYFFHGSVPFETFNYTYGATHFYQDPQIVHGPFTLLQSLGQYDAQWYMKIADTGYPYLGQHVNISDTHAIDKRSFAFFPLYPLALFFVNMIFRNIALTAFITTNIIFILDVISIYFVLTKLYSDSLATRTILLLFSFPFSIFYRSYFSEGLSLFLLIWFAYFFLKKRFFSAALFLGLLTVTRANTLALDALFLFSLLRDTFTHRISWNKTVNAIIILILPLSFWLVYCYIQTANFFYFYSIRSMWDSALPFLPDWTIHAPHIIRNILTILFFLYLPFHFFHASQVEVISIIVIGILLIKSRYEMNTQLWWISFFIWITPLFVTDTMSFTRYQMLSFPLFLYLAQTLRNSVFYLSIIIFSCLLFIISLYFINWYWIG